MKYKVRYTMKATLETEIDMDSKAYQCFESIKDAMDYDLSVFDEDPSFLLDQEEDMDFDFTAEVISDE